MKLKLLLFLGLFTICSNCESMLNETTMGELIEKTISDAKKWKVSRAVSGQEEFLKEKGGEESYFEEVKKALLGLANVALSEVNPKENVEPFSISLKTACDFSRELSRKVSESSEYSVIACILEIIEYYYQQYDLEIEQETDPRLERYIDYIGEATHYDWKGDE